MSLGGCDWALEELGVPGQDFAAARSAYRRLALELHPDRSRSSSERFQRVAAAWEAVQAARLTGQGASEQVVAERVSLGSFQRHGEVFFLRCRCGDGFEVPTLALALT